LLAVQGHAYLSDFADASLKLDNVLHFFVSELTESSLRFVIGVYTNGAISFGAKVDMIDVALMRASK
jgi:hypothetical protein